MSQEQIVDFLGETRNPSGETETKRQERVEAQKQFLEALISLEKWVDSQTNKNGNTQVDINVEELTAIVVKFQTTVGDLERQLPDGENKNTISGIKDILEEVLVYLDGLPVNFDYDDLPAFKENVKNPLAKAVQEGLGLRLE